MPVIPFIPLIAAGIGGGAAVISANMQSNATKQVAQIQSDSAAKALAVEQANAQASLKFAQQQWAQTQSNLAPYLAAGKATLGRLMSGLGIPYDPSSTLPGATTIPNVPNAPPIPGTSPGTPPPPQTAGGPSGALSGPQGPQTTSMPSPPGLQNASLASMYPHVGQSAPQAGPGSPMVPTGPQAPPPPPPQMTQMPSSVSTPMQTGSMSGPQARVRWADGQVMTVNSEDLSQYQALGAEVLT
jgi:hypothetical protein